MSQIVLFSVLTLGAVAAVFATILFVTAKSSTLKKTRGSTR